MLLDSGGNTHESHTELKRERAKGGDGGGNNMRMYGSNGVSSYDDAAASVACSWWCDELV